MEDKHDRAIHDSLMPKGWHTIKSVLLNEMRLAANFHLCCQVADGLFHARLIGERIARETQTESSEASGVVRPPSDE